MIRPNSIVGEGCKYGLLKYETLGDASHLLSEPILVPIQAFEEGKPVAGTGESFATGLNAVGYFEKIAVYAGDNCKQSVIRVVGNEWEPNVIDLEPNNGAYYHLSDVTSETQDVSDDEPDSEQEEGDDLLRITLPPNQSSEIHIMVDEFDLIQVTHEGEPLYLEDLNKKANKNGELNLGAHRIKLIKSG